ncbi:hypothetical protein GOBAR_DD22797 [Gossypium barbadense]|nr:hypothetical protein GOBAR_DD22797 [Gossypium barbadense]
MMENSEESAVDDQGSGWFQVKKKHRSSSKFSVQSWVWGYSTKNANNLVRGQPLSNKKGGAVQGKYRSLLRSSGGNSDGHTQDGFANSTAESNEDEKSVNYLDKCVLKKDCEDPTSPTSFVKNSNGSCAVNPKILSKDKSHMVHKIKWGDLEENVLVAHHENNIGAEIKFGDIGDDNVLGCSKNVNTSNLILCSCTDLQENTVEASMDDRSHSCEVSSLTPKDQIMEETFKEVNEVSSEIVEPQNDNEKIISAEDVYKDINTQHIKPIENSEVDPSFLSCQASETVVIPEVPDIKMEVGEPKTCEIPIVDGDSSIEMVSLDAVSFPPENIGPETLRHSNVTDCVQDGKKPDLSKAQIITALGEDDAGESKERFRERLWCFLFENLNRAVDELYLLCELECDMEQMKEAILVLEEAASDFKELTTRVEEFENVKKSSQLADGVPITLKSEHRRPHALSWEVRRMTTSPHRAEILSSSLEAFKKIQQERANRLSCNSMMSLGQDNSNCASTSGDNLKKPLMPSDVTSVDKELGIKSRKLRGGSDLTQVNLNGEKRSNESGKSSKLNSVQNGRDPPKNYISSDVASSRSLLKDNPSASVIGKSRREYLGSETEKLLSRKDKTLTREERAKAQQEEAELLAQKLAEKLSESEQRRKFYLEQIRERASMDFRDQSSPLLRRSVNKESQGRSTPTNSAEDCQANGSAMLGNSALAAGNSALQHSMKRRIKKIRQRLMALKFEISEPPAAPENTGIGYRTAVGTARAKIGRWLQELQKLRQARKEGASSIGLITAEMIKFLEGKEPELHASRQAGLLDFIASALPASHTSKPEACQVTIHLLKLLRVVLSTPVNRSYFLAQNLLPPMIPMLSAALENYIKIAASLNLPGSGTSLSCKTSLENFESVSEVLDGFLWAVSSIIGHVSSDERQLQMRDGLLELLVAYQVIQRFRDLFALYDRPQVEGSPFPSSILLSIHLLVVLTSSPGNSCINWESLPIEMEPGSESQETKIAASVDSRCSFVNSSTGDIIPQFCALNGSTVTQLSEVPEDRPLDEPCGINKNDNLVFIGKDGEKQMTDSSVELNNLSTSKMDVTDASQKTLVEQKEEKPVIVAREEKPNENISSLKQPVAFLLSAISETGLVSLPSLLTSVLLQANNKLPSEQASNALPSNFEEVATGVLKVLNNLALLDITFIQRMLARPDLKMEFFHLMSFLLSYCTSKWKAANDQIGLLLLESLLLLGYFALFHSGNQAVLRWGKSPTILHKVCDLPFVFFSDPELMPALAGTLLAACYGCEQNKDVVQQELSMDMLLSLLRSCRSILPTVKTSNPHPELLLADESSEYNQQGSDIKRSQADIPLKSSRYNTRNTRITGGKGGTIGNSLKFSKARNQRDCRTTKTCEETITRHNNNLPVLGTSLTLYCRFPSNFIDRAEQFFSAGISDDRTVS